MRRRDLQRLIHVAIAAIAFTLGVPPALAQTSGLKVQCHFQAGTTSSQIYTAIDVVNGGTATVPLSGLTVRYWYTEEGTQAQTYWCVSSRAVRVNCVTASKSLHSGHRTSSFPATTASTSRLH